MRKKPRKTTHDLQIRENLRKLVPTCNCFLKLQFNDPSAPKCIGGYCHAPFSLRSRSVPEAHHDHVARANDATFFVLTPPRWYLISPRVAKQEQTSQVDCFSDMSHVVIVGEAWQVSVSVSWLSKCHFVQYKHRYALNFQVLTTKNKQNYFKNNCCWHL